MCRTVHALLSTAICGIQMLVRVFMTIILMVENLIRMILQTVYNFISFVLQLLSLIPICVVFLVTARLKCFMCGGGGPCPVNRGGACDCLMSAVALIILFFIFRATGVLDKIFYKIGYVQAPPIAIVRFVPTPGDVTECSRNDSGNALTTTPPGLLLRYADYTTETETEEETDSTTTWTTILRQDTLTTDKQLEKTKGTKSSKAKENIMNEAILIPNPYLPKNNIDMQITVAQKAVVTSPPNVLSDDENQDSDTMPTNLTTVIYFIV